MSAARSCWLMKQGVRAGDFAYAITYVAVACPLFNS